MENKIVRKISIISLLLLFFMTITRVSASELNTALDESNFEFENENDDLKLGKRENNLLKNQFSLNGGSFSDIQNIIDVANHNDTIILNGNFYAENDASVIKIDKKLNIYSTTGAVLDGKGLSGIFYLNNYSSNTFISGLRFINGKQGVGAAVYVLSKNNTFDNCIFENNHGIENGGGAFATTFDPYATEGLTISNCIFKGNSAPASSGAAAIFATNFTVINTIFENNFASNNVGRTAYEGALQVGMTGTYGIVKNCTFKNNYAKSNNKNYPSRGGAMGLREGTIVENCKFINNNAEYGGAIIYFTGGEIINCSFSENAADYGGAIASDRSNNTLCINIINSNFTNNKANNGGALYLDYINTNISGSIFIGNVAKNYGGAIYNSGELKIDNCQFQKNQASSKLTAKLDSKKGYVNNTIDNAVFKITLTGGNNVIDAIWSKNSVNIDNQIIKTNDKIANQKITLKILDKNNKQVTHYGTTDKDGVATIKFDTKYYAIRIHNCKIDFLNNENYSASSTTFRLQVTKSVTYKESFSNKKLIESIRKYHVWAPTGEYILVKYELQYKDENGLSLFSEKSTKKIKSNKYSWQGASKQKVDGMYKWFKSRYYDLKTYKQTKTVCKYINGDFDSKTVNKNDKNTIKTEFKTYRATDWSKYVLPSQDCESDNGKIKKQSQKIIDAQAKKLNKKSSQLTDEQKASAILLWVQKNIKYYGYGNTLRGALETLNDKIGNCVDQTHLAVALLRAANIPAKYESKKVIGEPGHCWHRAYFNGHWRPGESTEQANCPKYGKSTWLLETYINKPPENDIHEESHRFNSKYVIYGGLLLKVYEKHLIDNNWVTYYGNVPSGTSTSIQPKFSSALNGGI